MIYNLSGDDRMNVYANVENRRGISIVVLRIVLNRK